MSLDDFKSYFLAYGEQLGSFLCILLPRRPLTSHPHRAPPTLRPLADIIVGILTRSQQQLSDARDGEQLADSLIELDADPARIAAFYYIKVRIACSARVSATLPPR